MAKEPGARRRSAYKAIVEVVENYAPEKRPAVVAWLFTIAVVEAPATEDGRLLELQQALDERKVSNG